MVRRRKVTGHDAKVKVAVQTIAYCLPARPCDLLGHPDRSDCHDSGARLTCFIHTAVFLVGVMVHKMLSCD